MATTGGTNLRDDIMRLDETGKFLNSSGSLEHCKWFPEVASPLSFFIYIFIFYSTCGYCHSWEDFGPHQKRSCKSQSSTDDCPG